MAAWANAPGFPNHPSSGRGNDINQEYTSQYAYTAAKDDELSLTVGMRLLVLDKDSDGWWLGKTVGGPPMSGWFPSTYVKESVTPVPNQISASPRPSLTPPSDKIMVARTLYPYAARYPEELTVEQFEVLDILEDPPNEPDWWMARNSEGETGLVPKNYVEEQPADRPPPTRSNYDAVTPQRNQAQASPLRQPNLPPVPSTALPPSTNGGRANGPIHEKPWFFADIDRQNAETKMLTARAGPGEYLLRKSAQGNDLCVSVKTATKFRHFKVNVMPNGQYRIGQRQFPAIEALFEYYTKAPIFTNGQEKVLLTRPFIR